MTIYLHSQIQNASTHTPKHTKNTLLLQNKFTKTQRKPIDERARMRFCRVKIDGN